MSKRKYGGGRGVDYRKEQQTLKFRKEIRLAMMFQSDDQCVEKYTDNHRPIKEITANDLTHTNTHFLHFLFQFAKRFCPRENNGKL